MNCKKSKIKMSVYLDGELNDKREKQKLLLHIKNCKECSKELEEMELLSKNLKNISDEKIEVSPYFYLKVKQKISNTETEKINFWKFFEFPKLKPLQVCFNLIIFVIAIAVGINVANNFSINKNQTNIIEKEMQASLNIDFFNHISEDSIGKTYITLLSGESYEK